MDRHLTEFLEQLRIDFESNKSGDVEIRVGKQKFNASKYILCLRSSVFAAMFQNNTKEKKTNIVEIYQFEAELVQKFLLYMYAGKIDNLNEIVVEMFKIGDYYDVNLLKKSCIEHMIQNTVKSNVIKYLELAKKFDLEDLKLKAVDFMLKNVDESTMHVYYEFAKKHLLDDVEKEVIDFVETNLTTISKTLEWQLLDFDFRHKILQDFFDQSPILVIHDKSSLLQGTSITVGGQEINPFVKHYSLKNDGNKSLYFKINIVKNLDDPDEVKIYGCCPKNGQIKPNESLDFTVQFEKVNFLIFIIYEAASKKLGGEQFKQNALIRQITLDPSKKYYMPIE